MFNWPKDNTAAKNAFYGDFHQKGWQDLNLTHYIPPFKMYYEKQEMKHGILVHHLIVPALDQAFKEIWEVAKQSQAMVDSFGASDWGGCFNIRQIAGSDNWSNHSWACAIDLSPGTNGFRYNSLTTIQHPVIDALKRTGALWGGDYQHRKDPMHFEWVSR